VNLQGQLVFPFRCAVALRPRRWWVAMLWLQFFQRTLESHISLRWLCSTWDFLFPHEVLSSYYLDIVPLRGVDDIWFLKMRRIICLRPNLKNNTPNTLSLIVHFSHTIVCLQTAITVSFSPSSSIYSYDLCWKEYPQNWDTDGQSASLSSKDSNNSQKIKYTAQGLNPGATYTFRLICNDADGNKGKPGPELVIDTEAVSCTPTNKCCVL